jgi:O-acetylhomoserine/O-acetylserine sulfhydrylase-like pyridoxal-dependent enzyme
MMRSRPRTSRLHYARDQGDRSARKPDASLKSNMQIPPQITFEGSEASAAAQAVISREIERLEAHNDRIAGCRVTVIAPSHTIHLNAAENQVRGIHLTRRILCFVTSALPHQTALQAQRVA